MVVNRLKLSEGWCLDEESDNQWDMFHMELQTGKQIRQMLHDERDDF